MDQKLANVRRQKHIWQIAFIILVVVIFVQTFLLYKDNPNVSNKVKNLLSFESASTLEVEDFLQNGVVHANPVEINGLTRPSKAGH